MIFDSHYPLRGRTGRDRKRDDMAHVSSEEHFERAAGVTCRADEATQDPTQHMSELPRKESHAVQESALCDVKRVPTGGYGPSMDDAGLDHSALTPSITTISASGGGESGARDASQAVHNAVLAEANIARPLADLAEVVAAWPESPEHIKTAIMVLARANMKEVS